MTQIVINRDHGGFGLSNEAIERLFELKNWKLVKQVRDSDFILYYIDSIEDRNLFNEYDVLRDDLDLVQVVKELGEKANSRYSNLKIVTIPDDVDFDIQEYDGREWIAEKHRTWC